MVASHLLFVRFVCETFKHKHQVLNQRNIFSMYPSIAYVIRPALERMLPMKASPSISYDRYLAR